MLFALQWCALKNEFDTLWNEICMLYYEIGMLRYDKMLYNAMLWFMS